MEDTKQDTEQNIEQETEQETEQNTDQQIDKQEDPFVWLVHKTYCCLFWLFIIILILGSMSR